MAADNELLQPSLVNGSFEQPNNALEGWKFTPGNDRGKIEPAPEVRAGRGAAHVTQPNLEWSLTNEGKIAAHPGDHFLATAYVKGSGQVRLTILGLKKDQSSEEIAGVRLLLDPNWVRLEADAVVPQGIGQVQLRIIGWGKSDVLIDDVTLERGAQKHQPKPKVNGFATQRVKENLDRGLIALPAPEAKTYLSWRLLDSDPAGVAFNVYRKDDGGSAHRVNQSPITATTDFTDTAPHPSGTEYFVRAVISAKEQEPSPTATPQPAPYQSIKLDPSETFQKVAIADLDGDGKPDFVIKQPDSNIDPFEKYWKRSPGTYTLEAYRSDGARLWTRDLGWAIEQGIWYSPYVVFDFDGDGKAEVAVKTGQGDPRDQNGMVTSGPEFLSILDGQTGSEITRIPWPPREGFASYNFYNRNQLAVAYLDGKTPCLIVERGTYNLIKVVAYQFHDRKLTELWHWTDAEDGARFRGQGAHVLRVADVDGDERDEVIIGSAVLDDNGAGLWSTGMGHPDQVTVGDLDPTHPGLEISYGLEIPQKFNGVCMADAKTGQILWGLRRPTTHIHTTAMASDIDPAHPGVEIYGGERDAPTKRYLFSPQGKLLSDNRDLGGLHPLTAYWDADPQREIFAGKYLTDFETGQKHEPRIDGTVVAVADLYGDWREEIITTLPGEMRIYSTTIPATDRRVTLMRDPIYRLDVATGSQGYYAVPALSRLPGFGEK